MPLDAVIHNFQEQLAYSSELSEEAAWVDFYRRLWPDMIHAFRIDKFSRLQQWGVDREILLQNGKRFSVDEKKRKKDYGDILLEVCSVADYDWERKQVIRCRKHGWAIDQEKRCDFIAYAIPSAGRCWLLPFELLRQTTVHNRETWQQNARYYPIPAKNDGYTTVSIAVPYDVFFRAMRQQMLRRFGSESPLPLPHEDTKQMALSFDHAATQEAA
jgi:hypothetical protein